MSSADVSNWKVTEIELTKQAQNGNRFYNGWVPVVYVRARQFNNKREWY